MGPYLKPYLQGYLNAGYNFAFDAFDKKPLINHDGDVPEIRATLYLSSNNYKTY